MKFQHEQLITLAEEIFIKAGCKHDVAHQVGKRLVEANLVGHDSHGVIRIPSYVEWLHDGKVLANQSIRIISENDVIAVVDGQFGLGQIVGEEAIQLGINKAAQHGVTVIALRNSGHLGRIGDWAEMAAEAGMLSLHFVNTSGAGMLVAPFGGIDRRLSANPFTAGVPTGDSKPIILDMSACTVAEGKIRVALNQGTMVEDGCLIDSAGNPTNDPRCFYGDPPGAILPIAGHKGSGLSLIIEMLAGALTGSSCTNPKNASRVANGMLSVIIDRRFFGSDNEFFPEVERFISFVKSSRTINHNGEILMPGELEQRTKAQRLEQGIELDEITWKQICTTCRSLNIEHGFIESNETNPAFHDSQISIPGCEPVSSKSGSRDER
ncbi:malate/lactate/ureidoglycolate dehydrogenase [Gimesia aquarii]|uniref:Putative oxidoreductase YbiC n=1 Tax=Gimesia aquarii TaxID=2527964 RepID=A0A517WZM6_9PLAN|nr:malate/lactate/ureidoglycolate dehydrogenase [Gimesia aquarii]QDU10698.1 putative oxidoreductase YbiC [Gimesia aquarii]